MAAADFLYLAVALLLGFALGVITLLVTRRKPAIDPPPPRAVAPAARPPPAAPVQPPPAAPPSTRPMPVATEEEWRDVEFEVVEDDAPPAPPRMPLPPPPALRAPTPPPPPARAVQPLPPASDPVPTEWARRHVGPLEPGRVKGICSGCGTPLSISLRRPIKIACPVCGRTRLLA